jgi:hypothetical protein
MRLIAIIFFAAALLTGVGCHSTSQTTSDYSNWPRTVNEAVTQILSGMNKADRELVRSTKQEDLILYHHGWGTGIRNDLGLWQGNEALMADCHADHPDGASMVIIEAVWQRLQPK